MEGCLLHSKILSYLLAPIMEMCSQYIIVIDGAEYISVDSFGEVLSELIYLLIDVMNQIRFIALFEVVSVGLLLCVVIFFCKAISFKKKPTSL